MIARAIERKSMPQNIRLPSDFFKLVEVEYEKAQQNE